jgi:hypothetical protein
MPKYQKNPTIVYAYLAPENIPSIGAVSGTTYVLQTADLNLHTLTTPAFASGYTQVSDSATLTGTDWS